jgi:hypothetical protein
MNCFHTVVQGSPASPVIWDHRWQNVRVGSADGVRDMVAAVAQLVVAGDEGAWGIGLDVTMTRDDLAR